ncbi:MAG: YIP1 family protein [Anaerolineales bacterium]|nr:YIP1 family protein [Anaerolineales bacterium]
MTTTTTSNPVRRFDLPRVFAVLFNPRAVFAEMTSESRATWLTPMLILSVTAILAVLTAGYLNTRAAAMGEISLPQDWQYWTPEMQDNYMQAQQATQGPVFMYVMPLISSLTKLWLGWFVFAGLLHLGSTLSGGRGSMLGSLNTVGWANLPYAIRDILRVAYMFLAQHSITSPSLSGFASGPGFAFNMLAGVDIFLFWVILLLTIGLSNTDGLTKGKSLVIVALIMLLILSIGAGVVTLAAKLSGAGL